MVAAASTLSCASSETACLAGSTVRPSTETLSVPFTGRFSTFVILSLTLGFLSMGAVGSMATISTGSTPEIRPPAMRPGAPRTSPCSRPCGGSSPGH